MDRRYLFLLMLMLMLSGGAIAESSQKNFHAEYCIKHSNSSTMVCDHLDNSDLKAPGIYLGAYHAGRFIGAALLDHHCDATSDSHVIKIFQVGIDGKQKVLGCDSVDGHHGSGTH